MAASDVTKIPMVILTLYIYASGIKIHLSSQMEQKWKQLGDKMASYLFIKILESAPECYDEGLNIRSPRQSQKINKKLYN